MSWSTRRYNHRFKTIVFLYIGGTRRQVALYQEQAAGENVRQVKRRDVISRHIAYRTRFIGCLALSLLLVVLLFRFFPRFPDEDPLFEDEDTLEEIAFDVVPQTEPQAQPPPPPSPRSPEPVPEDEVVEEEFELEDAEMAERFGDGELDMPGDEGDPDAVHENPSRPPNVMRIVEPVTPDQAREAGIRARLVVTFEVSPQGTVQEVSISRRLIYDEEEGDYVEVDHIGHGIEDATLRAASQWRFRPAEDEGRAVRALTRHVFTFGRSD